MHGRDWKESRTLGGCIDDLKMIIGYDWKIAADGDDKNDRL